MSKLTKTILTFIGSLVVAYIVVGYIANNLFVKIHWNESATALDKFREYYIRTYSVNIIPALILAMILTALTLSRNKKRA
ncbi:hypothetical protein [Clostridium sp. UBA1652]|uniref:hypothetical protein n=1 Tax=Clostridium sp. UBA1652 TaxID=1946348 RepID=UPI00257A27E6|nr:hypothetical protein [Clostridium sp. UBA1652]